VEPDVDGTDSTNRQDAKAVSYSTGEVASAETSTWEFTDPELLQQKRDEIIKAMSRRVGAPLIKRAGVLFWAADHSRRVACTRAGATSTVKRIFVRLIAPKGPLSGRAYGCLADCAMME
jgi:hypothetical protein